MHSPVLESLFIAALFVGCGPSAQSGPGSSSSTPASAPQAPAAPPAAAPPAVEPAVTPAPMASDQVPARDHLVTEPDGDQYWVIYRRDDAECDFVRLASGATEPTVLFTDGLGDFAETECETSIALGPEGATLYYLHADEVRGVSIAQPTEVVVLARRERFPRQLLVHQGQLVWLTLGADPYEDDLTGAGAVRAVALPRGRPRDLARGLTEPTNLRVEGDEIVIEEGGETTRERRMPVR